MEPCRRCGHPRSIHEVRERLPGRGKCAWCNCKRFIGAGYRLALVVCGSSLMLLACDAPGGDSVTVGACVQQHHPNKVTTACVGETP